MTLARKSGARRGVGAAWAVLSMVAALLTGCDDGDDAEEAGDASKATFVPLAVVEGKGLPPATEAPDPSPATHEEEGEEPEDGKPRDDEGIVNRVVEPTTRPDAQFPASPFTIPPDPTVAASNRFVVVTQNGAMTRAQKSGSGVSVIDQVRLGPVLGHPDRVPLDPRVQWDEGTNSFWVAALLRTPSGDTTESRLVMAQTLDGDDPFGRWQPWDVVFTTRHEFDQPQLQVTAEFVVLSWTVGSNRNDRVVINKDTLTRSAGTRVTAAIGVALDAPFMVPARSTSNPRPFVGVAHDRGSDRARVWIVSSESTTRLRNVNSEVRIFSTRRPPPASQPGGVPLDSGDDRFQSAFMTTSNRVWVTGADSCIPRGDSRPRACIRLVEIAIDGDLTAPQATARVVQDFDIGQTGADLMYPSLVVTSRTGSVLISHMVSSPSQPLTAGITVVPDGRLAPEVPGIDYAVGEGTYDCGCRSSADPRNRIGDYTGAVVDPSSGDVVWTVGQLTDSPAGPSALYRLEVGRFVWP